MQTAAPDIRDITRAQVIRYALESVAEDMATTLMRTSRSTVIKEVQDLSCALYDRSGRVVVQSKHAPMRVSLVHPQIRHCPAIISPSSPPKTNEQPANRRTVSGPRGLVRSRRS